MPEKAIDRRDPISNDSIENNAVDIDVTRGGNTYQGSAVSIGDGIMLTAAHNYIHRNSGQVASSIDVTLRKGHDKEGGNDTIRRSDMHNIGDYGLNNLSPEKTDFAVLTTDIKNTPTASMIVFENSNDATGDIVSAGYPGDPPFSGNRMHRTEGHLSENSVKPSNSMDYLRTDKDSSLTSDDGMGAVGGQSGSGVKLDYKLNSDDARLGVLDLDNKLAGTMTYGSIDINGDLSHDATKKGAGFTPITERLYGEIDQIAEQVGTENHKKETYRAASGAAMGMAKSSLKPKSPMTLRLQTKLRIDLQIML